MKDFGGDYKRHLVEAIELEPECVKRIARTAGFSRDIVGSILSSNRVSRESLTNALLIMSYESG
jgi:hypothetical protein